MELEDYRKEIDKIDASLSELFIKRMNVCRQTAIYKKENSVPVKDGSREKEVISAVCEKAPDELRDYVSMLYEKIFELSREYQRSVIDGEK